MKKSETLVRSRLWAASVAVSASMALGACGGGGGGGSPAPSPTPTPSPTPAPSGPGPSITSAPVETSAFVGGTATFSVTASGPTGAPLTYQWSRNGAAISGATNASYTTPALGLADQGATYSVQVTANGLNVTSGAVALRIVPGDAPSRTALARAAFGLIGLYAPATAPVYAAAPDAAVVGSPVGLCGTGTATVTGGPGQGAALPAGAATAFNATFNTCQLMPALFVDGSATTTLTAPAVPLVGSNPWAFASSLSSVRTRSPSISTPTQADFTANGGLLVTQQVSADAATNTLTDTVTLQPAAGFSHTDALRAVTMSLVGGTGTVRDRVTLNTATLRPTIKQQAVQMTGVGYTVGPVPYAVDGEAIVGYDNAGATNAGSGEIVLRSNALVVARIRGTAGGFVVDVDGATTPFAPPPSR